METWHCCEYLIEIGSTDCADIFSGNNGCYCGSERNKLSRSSRNANEFFIAKSARKFFFFVGE